MARSLAPEMAHQIPGIARSSQRSRPAARRRTPRGPAAAGSRAAHEEEYRQPENDRDDLGRPDRGVIELEEAVVSLQREEKEIRKPVSPPLGHQSFSRSATMRRRRASSGRRPEAAPRFSRTWST